jgi:hypothetical protein
VQQKLLIGSGFVLLVPTALALRVVEPWLERQPLVCHSLLGDPCACDQHQLYPRAWLLHREQLGLQPRAKGAQGLPGGAMASCDWLQQAPQPIFELEQEIRSESWWVKRLPGPEELP